MSIIFTNKVDPLNRANLNQQYRYANAMRSDHRHALNGSLFANLYLDAGGNITDARYTTNKGVMVANAGVSPTDLYREFDAAVVRQMHLDEGEAILSRLMPLSRSLSIGRTTLEYAASSALGGFQTSMSGELAQVYDSVDYDGRKAIIPVHQNGFKRGWREGEQLTLEGFMDAVIQQAEGVRTHRKGLVSYMLDGNANVSDKGTAWLGFRNDSTVYQVDLGAAGLNVDFTSSTLTGEDLRDAFIKFIDYVRLTNKIAIGVTVFVSNEILSNWQRYYSDNYASGTILEHLKRVIGVADIVGSSALSGNEMLALPLSTEYVQPLTGMAVSTIALPRLKYNDPYAFDVVSAVGFLVKNDYGSAAKGVVYASA